MNSLKELETDISVIEVASLVHDSLTAAPGLRLNRDGPTLPMVWLKLREEVQLLICTESTKYKEERTLFKVTYKPAVAALAAYLTRGLGVPTASASALASLALLLPAKMTVSAWCQAVKSGKESVKPEELAVLNEIASHQPGMRSAPQ